MLHRLKNAAGRSAFVSWVWGAFKGRVFDHYKRRFERGDLSVLFLAGHMRSGSSLLVHILNSNPEIVGYGETHHPYATARNVGELAYDLHRAFRRLRLSETYLMDKVLHPYLRSDAVLHCPATLLVFLVRAPEKSLPSIRDLGAPGLHSDQDVFDYYTGRLDRLVGHADRLADPRQSFFLTHRQLLSQTPQVLRALQDFLALEHPLSERYETTWATGRASIGDPSEVIGAGTIVREKKPVRQPFPEPLVREARRTYEQCVEALAQHCTSVPRRATHPGAPYAQA